MEEENKKARKLARREYNDDVRELAMFVRKRDKRVAKHQAEEAARRAQKQVRAGSGLAAAAVVCLLTCGEQDARLHCICM
jgi:hypothetical protein